MSLQSLSSIGILNGWVFMDPVEFLRRPVGILSRRAHGVAFETGRTEVDQLDPGVMDVTWRNTGGSQDSPRSPEIKRALLNPWKSTIIIPYYSVLSTIVSTIIIENALWSTIYPLFIHYL